MGKGDWTDATGQRIAKEVARRAWATEVLSERIHVFSWIDGLGLIAAVGIGGSFGAFFDSSRWLVDAAAGIGFFIGATAYVECLRLRRRLEAALVLLREDNPSKGQGHDGSP
jgi:hypothetical protein